MLDLNLCPVIYSEKVMHLLSLHLKISKPGKDLTPTGSSILMRSDCRITVLKLKNPHKPLGQEATLRLALE